MDTFCQIGDSTYTHVKLERMIFAKSWKLFFQIDNFCFLIFFLRFLSLAISPLSLKIITEEKLSFEFTLHDRYYSAQNKPVRLVLLFPFYRWEMEAQSSSVVCQVISLVSSWIKASNVL